MRSYRAAAPPRDPTRAPKAPGGIRGWPVTKVRQEWRQLWRTGQAAEPAGCGEGVLRLEMEITSSTTTEWKKQALCDLSVTGRSNPAL